MNGTLRAQWRVVCNLCPRNELISDAAIGGLQQATGAFKAKGWQRTRHGVWVCPQCRENTDRFLARAARKTAGTNQTAGWVKTLLKRRPRQV